MPYVKAWKHPRKKIYNENKEAHIKLLKDDATKSFHKKREKQLTDFLNTKSQNAKINSFKEFLDFISKYNVEISKLSAITEKQKITDYKLCCPIRDLLLLIDRVLIDYDQNLIEIRLKTRPTHNRKLYRMGARSWGHRFITYTMSDTFRFVEFYDINEPVRKKELEIITYNRLSDKGGRIVPQNRMYISHRNLCQIQLGIISQYSDKDLTYTDIGKEAVYGYTVENNCIDVRVVTIVAFNKDCVTILDKFAGTVVVPRHEIKNIF